MTDTIFAKPTVFLLIRANIYSSLKELQLLSLSFLRYCKTPSEINKYMDFQFFQQKTRP